MANLRQVSQMKRRLREKSPLRDPAHARLASVSTHLELLASDCSKVRHLSHYTFIVSQQTVLSLKCVLL